MSNLLNASEQLERSLNREPIGRPMLVAILFHALLGGGIASYALIMGLFPHRVWGGANDGGAISVNLVSNALPLPAEEKPNENVLATDTPSEAPAPPAPKAEPAVDEKAIPIASKIEAPKKVDQKKQDASKPTKPVPPVETPSKSQQHPQPTPKQDNRAQFGEQASSRMDRATQAANSTSNGPVTVTTAPGSRGFNFPWYIENIQRKMHQNLYRGEVDPRTPVGSRAYIVFVIRRDGSGSDLKLDRSSGSPTLDKACMRAQQRVDNFGPLPSPPSDAPPNVSYYCEY